MEMAIKVWPLPSIYGPDYRKIETQIEKDELTVLDLLAEGLLDLGETLYWSRPGAGELNVANVIEGGNLQVADGDIYDTPTAATRHFTTSNYNGWKQWRVGSQDGPTLDDLRSRMAPEEA